MRNYLPILLLLCTCFLLSCNSSDVKDVLDLAEGVPRKTIDANRLGVNSFANDRRFGEISSQLNEVRDVLRLNYIRVLFAWSNEVQPTPLSNPDFSLYDEISSNLPPGTETLVVITGLPDWMSDPQNWMSGNPRTDFVEQWVKKVVNRYARNRRITAFEIWNEPNMESNRQNQVMGFLGSAENYVELLADSFNYIKSKAPTKLVVSAATTSINQDFPATIDYNRRMRDAGAQAYADIWAVHYYGKQFENVIRDGGVADFLNGLDKPIWITESGAQGVNEQLAYGEQVWPYLTEHIFGLQRIYQYQHTEATPAASTYGLRNLTSGFELSDLYVWLRDRP